jgi:outer membrane protein
MSYWILVLGLLLPLGFITAARAETLQEAWDAAGASHALIAAARERREAALLDLEGAKSDRKPDVKLTTGYMRVDQAPSFAFSGFASPPLFDDDDFVLASAEMTLPLYTGGALSHGIAAAQSAAEASLSQVGAISQTVRLAVASAYIDVLRAESALGVADSNVATLSAHTADARNRYESGAVPRNDFLAASVALAGANQRRLQAMNALELARSAYNRLLGRDLSAPVELESEIDLAAIVPETDDLDALLEMARSRRPELAAIEANAEALREQSAAERGGTRPQLALTGGYHHIENQVLDEDGFWTVGIGFEWNLFDSGRRNSRAAGLTRRANALLRERADLEAQIALEIRQALLDGTAAVNRRAVAVQAVEQAAENLDVARDRYISGAGTNADVLDAEVLRTQSLNNLDNAGFDLKLARLRLARAVGAL